ncbi:transglutaminaseTgpA domain-containing protein [Pseudofrankia inefficax]|uniref:Transglutaminase domain-containing protein n=1 Tax=Pseudofrankia inefficax (strain DSM 45817 / CECT 9037 / DDB 130130 / EuI1c) TaxID=298654 RepID=E3J0B8_PSEI1|nr:DUF3488 and transglutaminase-like domain-containing protein [Pseudofrankia inefficax]ADP80401.1 transglutaminase domain-containing protein [Pseudofrankia inefficax]
MTRPATVRDPGFGRSAGRRVAPAARLGAARGQAVPTLVGALASLLCASSLRPLFDGFFWWFGPVLLAVLAVVGLAALGRALGLGPSATVVLSLAGLLLTLTVLCARSEAWLGFVPTRASLTYLLDLMSSGRQDMSRLAAPVPSRPGLVVLTVLGAAFVALVVDLLVVGAGRPTLAGLPLLGLFAVPAAVLPHGVGAGPFTLGVLGFLALLLLDGRTVVHRWGRLVTTRGEGRTQLWLGGLAGRVALGALLLAVLAPLVLPTLDNHGLLHRANGPTGSSGPAGTRTTVQWPMVTLQDRLHVNQQQPLLTVRTTGAVQLRTVALEDYDAVRQSFNLRELSGNPKAPVSSRGLPGPPDNVDTRPVTATISIEPGYSEDFLPTPWVPTSVQGLGSDWLLDKASQTIFNPKGSAAGSTYTVTAADPAPSRQEQTAKGPIPADIAYDTKLPDNLDPQVRALAQSLATGRTSDFDKVRAIQDYFHNGTFHYDLNGAPTGQDALHQFLFVSKTGYCEQFASAMTLLVRALGIPARVAVGFIGGERRPDGSVLIRGGDAHAWPEVWLPGTGWIAFEPTPRTDGVTLPSYAGGTDQPTTPPDDSAAQTQQPTPGATASQPSGTDAGNSQSGQDGSTAQSSGHTLTDLAQTLQDGDLSQPRLSVRTSNPDAFRDVFLRETALDDFNGTSGFTEQALPASGDPPLDHGLPGPPAGVATTKLTATISVHPDFHESELPVPAVATSVSGLEGSWQLHQATGTIYADAGTTAAGAVYTVQAQIPNPSPDQLARSGPVPAALKLDLALPAGLDPRIGQQAQTVTATATTAYAKADALLDYLTSAPFTYDVHAPAGSVSDLLFGTHTGFCNHYATAMAVMARTLGIPARVAEGYAYTADVRQPDGSLLYKAGNWHAWTEVWLPGAGWVAFNPTPVGDLDLGTNTWKPQPGQKQLETGGQTGTAAGSTGTVHGVIRVAIWVLIALAGLALLATPAIARVVLRRRRLGGDPARRGSGPEPSAAAAAAEASARVRAGWTELLDVATDLGIPLRLSDSPRMVIARLDRYLSAGPEATEDRVVAARAALARLAWAEERVRYAPPGTSVGAAADTVAADVTIAVGALLSVAPRSRRLVAQVAPPSVLRRATRSGAYGAAERAWRRRPARPAPPAAAEPEPEPSEPAAQA